MDEHASEAENETFDPNESTKSLNRGKKSIKSADFPAHSQLPELARLPKSYSMILSRVQEDLSTMTLVAPTNEFRLVPRIHGWRPIPSARILKAAELQKQKDCPLCHASPEQHAAAWYAYGIKRDATAAVRASQDGGVTGVTPKIIKQHFPNHNYEQPAPKRIKTDDMLYLGQQLKPREQKILQAVYRQRVLSTRQIIDLFFQQETSNNVSAQKSAYRTLHKLRHGHFLYPYRTRNKRSPEVFYFLGRYAAPWIESQEGSPIGNPYVSSHADIKEYLLEHDSKAADVYVQMRKQLYANRDKNNVVSVNGTPQHLYLDDSSWYGARGLNFGYPDPFTGTDQKIIPDGFGTLNLNDGRHMQFRLPFFYEWDSGAKNIDETIDQLTHYVGFAMSGAVGKRFPQLEMKDYFPPILVVTNTPLRAHKLAKGVRAACAKYGDASVPPIFTTDQETLGGRAFAPGSWNVAQGDGSTDSSTNIAEHLLAASEKLNQGGGVHWRVALLMDPEGAVPKASGFVA